MKQQRPNHKLTGANKHGFFFVAGFGITKRKPIFGSFENQKLKRNQDRLLLGCNNKREYFFYVKN